MTLKLSIAEFSPKSDDADHVICASLMAPTRLV